MSLQTNHQLNSSHPASTYLSKVKLIATSLLLVFALQMVAAQPSYAGGCAATAMKSVIATGVVAVGLVVLDFAFTGGIFTAIALANAGSATALAAKGVAGAAVTGCAESWIFDRASTPSPSR